VTEANPEEFWIAQAAKGDQRAFERLYRAHVDRVHGLCIRMTRNTASAEDCTQQAFIQVWRTIGQLQHPERFPGWLKRVGVNVWLQHHRRSDVLASSETLDDHEGQVDHTTGVALDVDHALALLPSAVRLCVVLSYHAQMSHAEIAETTSLPLGTVKSHIRRGTERLESLLSAYSEGATRGVAS